MFYKLTEKLILASDEVFPPKVEKPPKQPKPKKERGPINPKRVYLQNAINNSKRVKWTYVNSGEVRVFKSLYETAKETGHDAKFLGRNNGRIVDEHYKITMD
jgi:hypothetical protein